MIAEILAVAAELAAAGMPRTKLVMSMVKVGERALGGMLPQDEGDGAYFIRAAEALIVSENLPDARALLAFMAQHDR